MRILFLSNFYPPYEIGGYEQWAYEVETNLRNKGHQVHVLTSRYGKESCNILEEGNVVRTLYLQSDTNYYRPADFFIRVPIQERFNIREIKRNISIFQPDVILVWGMWNLSLNLPYHAEKMMPGRVGYYLASYWPADSDPHRMYWKLPANRLMTKPIKGLLRILAEFKLNMNKYPPALEFKHVVCCSKYVRDTLVSSGKLPESAGVLYGGIDPRPFSLPCSMTKKFVDRSLKLLYFGRLVEQKGVVTAIEALSILKQRGITERIELTIVGSGHPGYETKLRYMVDHLGIGNQVSFRDWVTREDLPKLLQKFDVYLFTSVWPEPMARSVMEAMAAGLVVIGSEVGGQTEMLIDGLNALTFQPDDAMELSNQILKILEKPSLHHQLANAGNEMVNHCFTLDRMADEIEVFLEKISSIDQ